MEFLFKSRGEGKRTVKPSQDIALLEHIAAESSDDSDFKVNDDDSDDDNSDDSTSSKSDESSDDDEEESASAEEALDLKKDLTTAELIELAQKENSKSDDTLFKVKVCGACLGETSNDFNEIVECDGCGVSVHEGCYGITESGSIASTISSASTEPWFCEPCRAGKRACDLSCELCPVMGGILKETDVGKWVHLVCALYVPGVAFGEPDKMTHITIFEMNYSSWGRRACMLCEDPKLARTGVCIQCDAGLCKSYFHVSCGQAHGLLAEPSFVESDPYLAHCRIHSDKTVIKNRKRCFITHMVQARRRGADILERNKRIVARETSDPPGERILRKLDRQHSKFLREKKVRVEPWIPTQKIPRMLTTSASALRKIQKKGELNGVDARSQEIRESQILSIMDVKKKWHIPPAFSVEFVAYFYDRQRRIDRLKNTLSEQIKTHSALREEQPTVGPRFEAVSKAQSASLQKNKDLRALIESYTDTLNRLSESNKLPDLPALRPLKSLRPHSVALPMRPKATMWAAQNSVLPPPASSIPKSPDLALKFCALCKRSTDQHLLAHCDTCKLHYHLGCLTPPLTRMPKKSKLYGWQCSECDRGSSSDEGPSNVDVKEPRKLRQNVKPKHFHDDWIGDEVVENGRMTPEEEELEVTKDSSEQDVRESLIEKAAAKAEKKKRKREEKERRKAEKKLKKKGKGEQMEEGDVDEDDIEIVEDENGQCVVRIKPKPIQPLMLKIKKPQGTEDPSAEIVTTSNGHNSEAEEARPPPKKRKKRQSSTADVRTRCDQCQADGENVNLVRCDDCRRCFHFWCLNPPVKKSPKVPGYGWHCDDCDPSDQDSDWHLD